MPTLIAVKPAKGATLPLEGSKIQNRRDVDGPRMVPNTNYYRRALRRGDLVHSSVGEIKEAKGKADEARKQRKATADKRATEQKAANAKQLAKDKTSPGGKTAPASDKDQEPSK